MPEVTLLIGRIASGKTHYAEKLARETGAVCAEPKAAEPKVLLLSCDELMLTLFDQCLGERHEYYETRCKQYLMRRAAELVGAGVSAILDSGFWRREEREQTRRFFREQNIPMTWIYCRPEEAQRLQWLRERNARLMAEPSGQRRYIIPEQTRIRLDSLFEEPAAGEYDRIYPVIDI
ncbi:MAG: ATP-binding protein [Oscillospiraceae bacterium]|nr:ATP-binding protein [Oscillospiraceae bacterium]